MTPLDDIEHVAHPHYQQAVQQVKDHRFFAMIVASILVALFLVFAAMALYNSSGAAQLDLSRPGYESVRKAAQGVDTSVSYPSTGKLDTATLDEFAKKYDAKLKEATATDPFASDLLSPESLQIDQATASAAAQTE